MKSKPPFTHKNQISFSRCRYIHVKIPYAKIDIISVQLNFTTIAYAGSLKETQSQDRHIFILGNPQGEENPTKLPLYR